MGVSPKEGRKLSSALLPLMSAIPISNLRSVWDLVATLFLLLTIIQWRAEASLQPWVWLTCSAIAGLAVSALANGQQFTSMFGALVSVGSMMGTLIFIRRLYCRNSIHGLLAGACLATGEILHTVLVPNAVSSTNLWKYGVGFGAAIVLLALTATTRRTSIDLSAMAMLAIISLATGTRGLTGSLVIASVLVISRGVARQRSLMVRIAATMVIAVPAVTVALTLGGSLVNSPLANSARDKFVQQAAINSNPIFAGRTEPPISIAAVMTHPVIGAGANPEPTSEIISRALQVADFLGYKNPTELVPWWTQDNKIYTHSLVMEYWVVGGVLAALPFIAALGIFIVGLVRSLRIRKNIPAVVFFLAVQSLSNILFAPETWGTTALVGLSVGMMLVTSFGHLKPDKSRSEKAEEPPRLRPQLGVAHSLSL